MEPLQMRLCTEKDFERNADSLAYYQGYARLATDHLICAEGFESVELENIVNDPVFSTFSAFGNKCRGYGCETD